MWPIACLAASVLAAEHRPLSSYADSRPLWLELEANSEQRQPLYLGLTPLELARGDKPKPRPILPESLRRLGETQARGVLGLLGRSATELEAWPVQNDDGLWTWAFARYRESPADGWKWLDLPDVPKTEPTPALPRLLDPARGADRSELFDDFLKLPSLYAKPVFGDCVWTRGREGPVIAAWMRPGRRENERARLSGSAVCRVLSQPPRFNDRPISFVLAFDERGLRWPDGIEWRGENQEPAPADKDSPAVIRDWPANFEASFAEDVRILSTRFSRKNSAQPDHQLGELVDYLEERYRTLGLKTRKQEFSWRGIRQSNLIALIPGTAPGPRNPPVVIADHIDTAFAEDEFEKSGRRVSAPGADDNATGTAALLKAADVLRSLPRKNDVWLVHLTGEEFPGDDLGARYFVQELLKSKTELSAIVLLDMIGYRKPDDPLFQINSGRGPESERAAQIALAASRAAAPGFKAVVRPRSDPRSYLYNTDGLIFSDAGYPVILFNEHINRLENFDRPHYHQSTDTPDRLDWPYAAAIVRTALETAARLSLKRTPNPTLPPNTLPIPVVRQATTYSCGAAALLSVLYYWQAYDGTESSLYKPLDLSTEEGVEPPKIAEVARQYGLKAHWKENLRLEDLRAGLRRGETVIIDLQAWRDGDDLRKPWSEVWESGHYVVLAGMDEHYAYVMDPSTPVGYAYLPLEELVDRWHDYESRGGKLWRYQRLAVFIQGKKPLAAGSPGLTRLE